MAVIDSVLREVNQPCTLVALALEKVLKVKGEGEGWPDSRQERARENLLKLKRAFDAIKASWK